MQRDTVVHAPLAEVFGPAGIQQARIRQAFVTSELIEGQRTASRQLEVMLASARC